MKYREILSEIELGGGVDSNILKPFPNYGGADDHTDAAEPKIDEPKQLELFKDLPVAAKNYTPLGKISGKYIFAELKRSMNGFSANEKGERTFVLFADNGKPVGVLALTAPDSEDGAGRRGPYVHYELHGLGYRVSTVKIDPDHSGQGLAIKCYYFLLQNVCDFLMADTMQTSDGAALWQKMLNSRKFAVQVFDAENHVKCKRRSGKDFNHVYNTSHLYPFVTLPHELDQVLYGDDD
jgi:hypothetical protein